MEHIALQIHLLFAAGVTLSVTGVIIFGFFEKNASFVLSGLYGTFSGVTISGIYLIVLKPLVLSHVCLSMSVVTFMTIVSAMYYKKQTTIFEK